MDPLYESESDDPCLAFDLLNADDPNGSDCAVKPRSRRRPISTSFDSGQAGQQTAPARIRQPLLQAIHQELSLLAAEADGVSEKVKVLPIFLKVDTPVLGHHKKMSPLSFRRNFQVEI